MKARILGLRTNKNAKNEYVSTIYFELDFEDWESAGNTLRCEGSKVDSEYLGTLDVSELKVGEIVELYYRKGFQGKATICAIIPVSPTGESRGKNS